MLLDTVDAWSLQFIDSDGHYTDVLVSKEALDGYADIDDLIARNVSKLEAIATARHQSDAMTPIIIGRKDLAS
jgi:hypothetical protein